MKEIFFIALFSWCTLVVKSQSPDYTMLDSWAAHADKKDYADSVPFGLETKPITHKINVFFVHPTTYTDTRNANGSNASISDVAINKKTDEGSILFQASAFNNGTIVYAPRYRQAHISAFFGAVDSKAALDTAYADVKKAFEQFLVFNKDNAIILAAHSQGTVHVGRLIKEFFEGKPLMEKLIVAYLVGMPIRKNYFSTCVPCSSAKQTSCFVSWRSYLTGTQGEPYIQMEAKNSVYVTNPLTWTLNDSTAVSRKHNKGAIFYKFNKVLKRVSGAQMHNNILWVTKPKFAGSFLVRNKMTNYHIADINMFYANIRENVSERSNSYFSK
jgi:hypothetical protein